MSLLRRIEKKEPAAGSAPSGPAAPGGAAPDQAAAAQRRPASPPRDAYIDLKSRVQNRLVAELDPSMDIS
ncbi:MAG TPA: CpaF family protein, partial [Anaerolineae bacterium]|nr:CpaF family protein [Anaerolineae bacterium]